MFNFRTGDSNTRGATLYNFAEEHRYIIANAMLNKAKNQYLTQEIPKKKTHNMIENIIVSNKNVIQDFDVITTEDKRINDRLVRAKIRLDKNS